MDRAQRVAGNVKPKLPGSGIGREVLNLKGRDKDLEGRRIGEG